MAETPSLASFGSTSPQTPVESSIDRASLMMLTIWCFYLLYIIFGGGLISAGAGPSADFYHKYGDYLTGSNLILLGISSLAYRYRGKNRFVATLPIIFFIIAIIINIWIYLIAS